MLIFFFRRTIFCKTVPVANANAPIIGISIILKSPLYASRMEKAFNNILNSKTLKPLELLKNNSPSCNGLEKVHLVMDLKSCHGYDKLVPFQGPLVQWLKTTRLHRVDSGSIPGWTMNLTYGFPQG